jgi:hypothetical protein
VLFHGLAKVGQPCYVKVAKGIFPIRVDILHSCSINGIIGDPLMTTPDQRRAMDVKGDFQINFKNKNCFY